MSVIPYPNTNETKISLKKLDDWLSKTPWIQNRIDIGTANKCRDTILKIEQKGFYTDVERELLNTLRTHYHSYLLEVKQNRERMVDTTKRRQG